MAMASKKRGKIRQLPYLWYASTGQIMRVDTIPIGTNPPFDINVLVEVPIGGEPIKYELDKASGTLFVDRMLYTAMRYPGNYGFIPQTLSDDGDPIDVLIANSRPILPGAVCNCRPVGVLFMKDEAGGDEKIVAVPSDRISPLYREIKNYLGLPEMLRQRIAHFFEHYKDLEAGKWVELDRWGDEAEARATIEKAIKAAQRHRNSFEPP
jgi:inorganic pyrophosphatase